MVSHHEFSISWKYYWKLKLISQIQKDSNINCVHLKLDNNTILLYQKYKEWRWLVNHHLIHKDSSHFLKGSFSLYIKYINSWQRIFRKKLALNIITKLPFTLAVNFNMNENFRYTPWIISRANSLKIYSLGYFTSSMAISLKAGSEIYWMRERDMTFSCIHFRKEYPLRMYLWKSFQLWIYLNSRVDDVVIYI